MITRVPSARFQLACKLSFRKLLGNGELHTRRRISLDHRILFAVAIALAMGPLLGGMWLNHRLLLTRCPTEAFIAGLSRSDENRQIPAFIVASTILAMFLWAVLVRFLGTRKGSNTDSSMGRFWFRLRIDSINRKLAIFGGPPVVVLLLILIPISTYGPKYCLADDVIFVRPSPSDEFHRYSWGSVARIETFCEPAARGHWRTSFTVTMQGGASFDLLTAGRDVLTIYPRVVRNLQGASFVFHYYGVEDCEAPFRDVVVHRP